jgi:hypothetical protein
MKADLYHRLCIIPLAQHRCLFILRHVPFSQVMHALLWCHNRVIPQHVPRLRVVMSVQMGMGIITKFLI